MLHHTSVALVMKNLLLLASMARTISDIETLMP